MKDLMLYFHIPFCVSKCAYCSFYSIPKAKEELKEEYATALIRQTKLFENSDKYTVRSVYFGGGTPTVLGVDRLEKVFNSVFKTFNVINNAEVTIEVNPCTVDKQWLSLLKSIGVNRLSIGAQSFNDKTLKLLNRAHSADDFLRCYSQARKVGFSNISADLIFALPNETLADFTHSVNSLIELKPEHVSIYGLSVDEGTPLFKNKSSYAFPSEDEEEQQYEVLCELLKMAGYSHYEISNFSLPNYESKHNCGYWQRMPYFGFGAGAHSFFKCRRFEAARDVLAFIKNSHISFTAPTNYDTSVPLSEVEAEEERIMLGLRLKRGVEITKPVPKYLLDNGLVKKHGNTVSLTERGFRVSNSIIAMLI